MTTRTDTHRPSAINPREYDFVASDYIGPGASDTWRFLAAERQAFRAHVERTGGKYSGHEHGGTCHICGATAFYIAKFHHRPTNTYICTGEDCAQKLDMGNPVAFRTFRDKVHGAREAQAGKNKAQTILADNGLTAAWTIYATEGEARANFKYEESTITDIVGKLVRYGSVSGRQLDFVRNLLTQIDKRAGLKAAREAADANAKPLPKFDGRATIEGVVLSIKTGENAYGPYTRMLVRADDGWKVFGSVPAQIADVQRGDRVRFAAKVEPSKDDPKFGFFSRPAKGEIIPVAAPATEPVAA